MSTASQKGSHYERELTNRFREDGWGCLRLGSSGSGTKRELPDILAGIPLPGVAINDAPSDVYAVELKSGDSTTLYVTEEEANALGRFADRWGATPLLGARFTTQSSPTATYLVHPFDARMVESSGRYGLPLDDIQDRSSLIVGPGGVEHVD